MACQTACKSQCAREIDGPRVAWSYEREIKTEKAKKRRKEAQVAEDSTNYNRGQHGSADAVKSRN